VTPSPRAGPILDSRLHPYAGIEDGGSYDGRTDTTPGDPGTRSTCDASAPPIGKGLEEAASSGLRQFAAASSG
jgi:hypothetical protein